VRAPERARDAAARRSARRAGDGTLYLAAPDDMLPDSYLAMHEQNPIAAQALFWANTSTGSLSAGGTCPLTPPCPRTRSAGAGGRHERGGGGDVRRH
jgi:hypothetical protein